MKPKADKPKVNYFQLEQVEAIRDALELEPIKWRAFIHMLLITGARRGEILGLKWVTWTSTITESTSATAFCITRYWRV